MPTAETILHTERQRKAGSQVSVTLPAEKLARASHSDAHASAAVDTTESAHLNRPIKHVVVTVGLYMILISGGLWASIDLLRWFWHQLL
jgi:hypothetical protein